MSQPKVSITTKSGEVLYSQVLPDSKVVNKLIAAGMNSPVGDAYIISVENNGHQMSFPVTSVDVDTIVRAANGIVQREKKEAV